MYHEEIMNQLADELQEFVLTMDNAVIEDFCGFSLDGITNEEAVDQVMSQMPDDVMCEYHVKYGHELFKQLVNERRQQGVVLGTAWAYYPESDERILHPIFFWVNKSASERDVIEKFINDFVKPELECFHKNGSYVIDCGNFNFTIEDCEIGADIDADPEEVWKHYCDQTIGNVNNFKDCYVWLSCLALTH